ncbi:MAG: cation diffusion facilitator family transporter [Rhodospirillales bacterium]|nr:MAG: cation diffusion facilitator family transporter [Rhodospirillales bacterium]
MSDKQNLKRWATYAAVATALTLIVIKLAAWVATGSIALLSTLIDSLLDAGASVVNLVAVRQALQPADRDHRFGHGKAEPLAGLAQAAFVAGSGLFLVIEAAGRFAEPQTVTRPLIGVVVMAVSIVLTLILVVFQKFVVKKTKSVAVDADSLHYTGDVLINLSVIASLLLTSQLGFALADPLFAILIALYLLWNALGIARSSMDHLMDREFPGTERDRIKQIARTHPGVMNVHDLRTRSSGTQGFIQLHLELDGQLPLVEAHAIADAVELKLREAFPEAEVIIHQDPAGLAEPHQIFK